MAKKKNKKMSKKRQRKITSVIVISFILVVGFIWYITNYADLKQIRAEKEEELASLEDELREKQKELNKKNMEANYYQSDENIEKVAKEELGLVNPQEVVFIQSN
ncbi:MAG: septum formation initiator family protein [Clostridia bacterium]|nr:septum formation initiator family protein [Clostridia bacterium]